MTATELYQTDPEFQALIQCWIADKRCPIPMADYLRERGLEGQAETAEWAAWRKASNLYPTQTPYTYPHVDGGNNIYWWFEDDQYPHHLPWWLNSGSPFIHRGTFLTALLWLLDRWAEVAAQGIELPKAKVGSLC